MFTFSIAIILESGGTADFSARSTYSTLSAAWENVCKVAVELCESATELDVADGSRAIRRRMVTLDRSYVVEMLETFGDGDVVHCPNIQRARELLARSPSKHVNVDFVWFTDSPRAT
jgi:hypothetical protein